MICGIFSTFCILSRSCSFSFANISPLSSVQCFCRNLRRSRCCNVASFPMPNQFHAHHVVAIYSPLTLLLLSCTPPSPPPAPPHFSTKNCKTKREKNETFAARNQFNIMVIYNYFAVKTVCYWIRITGLFLCVTIYFIYCTNIG